MREMQQGAHNLFGYAHQSQRQKEKPLVYLEKKNNGGNHVGVNMDRVDTQG
jgi:hypothetical protein